MTTSAELLNDAFGRIHELVEQTVEGLDIDQLSWRVDVDANTIAWLVWHLTRVQDSSIASASAGDQVWITDGWSGKFALPFDDRATGYGQSSGEVGSVRASAELLLDYHAAVSERTVACVASLDEKALDRVVDTRFDPPVTLAVRLVSIISDELQHAGQAAFVRGVVLRRH
jgi:hypothetical protein